MLKLLAGALALAFLAPVVAHAQTAVRGQRIVVTGNPPGLDAVAIYCDDGTGKATVCPNREMPATSTAQTGTVTSTTATATSGTATISAGTAKIGPLTPQLGREVRVVLRGTWTGTFAVSTSVDGCATLNPLTIGGSTWGVFTANANEAVDLPTLAGVTYCATATVQSGSLSYALRQ